MEEVFKDIPSFEGLYALSKKGELWSYPNNKHNGKLKKIQKENKFTLWKNGKAHTKRLSVLMRETFGA